MKKLFLFSAAAVTLAIVATVAISAARADDSVQTAQTILKNEGYYTGPTDGKLNADTKAALRRYQIRSQLEPTGELTPETSAALKKEGQEAPAAETPAPPVPPSTPAPAATSAPYVAPAPAPIPVPAPPYVAPEQNPAPALPPPRPAADFTGIFAHTPYEHAEPAVQTDTVRKAQARLSERKIYDGPVNGLPGPATEEALLRFQSARDLPRTGRLDIDTLAELHLLPVAKHPRRQLPARPPGAVRGVPLD